MGDIEERLRNHNRAFESLLNLIPSKYYYEGTSQWGKKRQTKEQAKKARMAKLDPDNAITVKEVLEKKDEQTQRKIKKQQKAADENGSNRKAPTIVNGENQPESRKLKPTKKQTKTSAGNDQQASEMSAGDIATELGPGNVNTCSVDKPNNLESNETKPSIVDLRRKLENRIADLRNARNASDTPKNKETMIEARRRNEAAKQEKKKQEKREAKEAQRQPAKRAQPKEEAQLVNGKPTQQTPNLTFGRVELGDGSTMTPDLSETKRSKKRKGPSDTLGALRHAEAKRARMEAMDDEAREAVEEKEKWRKALLQSTGEKVKDDEKLLGKSLKRQQKQKKKSEKEWKERIQSVEKSKAMKQKKRDENIAARKEAKKGNVAHKKKRPGFEGSVKAKHKR